jgi:hypothetical protein
VAGCRRPGGAALDPIQDRIAAMQTHILGRAGGPAWSRR